MLASVGIVSFLLSHLDFHITQQLSLSLKIFFQALSSSWGEDLRMRLLANDLHYHIVFYLKIHFDG